MEEKKVSIIIPVYNAEKYLDRCLNSILNQEYNNYEVIIIDDGSTDGSKMIIDDFIKKDSRFNNFTQANSGVSIARNKGLELATADYICFLDSDDWYDAGYLKEMLFSIGDSDICYCNGFYQFDGYNKSVNRFLSTSGNKYDYFYDNIKSITCSFMIKKGLIIHNDIKFQANKKWAEDFEFFSKCFINAQKISCCNKKLYFLNTESSNERLSNFSVDKIKDDIEAINELINYPAIDLKTIEVLKTYRLPALIIYRLYRAFDYKVDLKEIIKYYHDCNKYIENFKMQNGLRGIKLMIYIVLLKNKMRGIMK